MDLLSLLTATGAGVLSFPLSLRAAARPRVHLVHLRVLAE